MSNQRVEPGYWYPAVVNTVTSGVNGTGEYYCVQFEVLLDFPNRRVPGFFYAGSGQWTYVRERLSGPSVDEGSLDNLLGHLCWVLVRADLKVPRRRSQVVWVEAPDFDLTCIPTQRLSLVEGAERFHFSQQQMNGGGVNQKSVVATVTDIQEEGDKLTLVFGNEARWTVRRRGGGWKALAAVWKNLTGEGPKKGDLQNPQMLVGHVGRITAQGDRVLRVDRA